MKRLLALAMTTLMLMSVLTGCGSTESTAAADNDKAYHVAIIQLVTHDALDAATQGFQDALVAELGEENVNFDLQNAAAARFAEAQQAVYRANVAYKIKPEVYGLIAEKLSYRDSV